MHPIFIGSSFSNNLESASVCRAWFQSTQARGLPKTILTFTSRLPAMIVGRSPISSRPGHCARSLQWLRGDHRDSARVCKHPRFIDLGDLIEVSGVIGRSKNGEFLLFAGDWRMNAKCLHPLPNKWKGLTELQRLCDDHAVPYEKDWDAGALAQGMYEHLVEDFTEFPTFYKDFPPSPKNGTLSRGASSSALPTANSPIPPINVSDSATQRTVIASGRWR